MARATLTAVGFRYPDAPADALRDVDLHFAAGQLVLLAGGSGSGKSTLLRVLCGLVPHFHGGRFRGRADVCGLDTRREPPARVCARAGIVFQDPEAGALMATVDREVAFALENAGRPAAEIGPRVREALAAVGAAHLLGRRLAELSGGELQRVALAAALAPEPGLLLLDEPTSQLDPAAADGLVALLRQLADRSGVAVIVADHRTARIAPAADRCILLHEGRVVADGPPATVPLPDPAPPAVATTATGGEPLARLEGVCAGYGSRDVLWAADLELRAGTVTALAGPNGSGKTTLARVLAGLHAVRSGRVWLGADDVTEVPAERRFPRVGYVGQDPGRYLLHERVDEEVAFALRLAGAEARERSVRALDELRLVGLAAHARRHPRDLSGGERERVALASVLVARPRVVVLDEPTRGMDAASKGVLAERLRRHAAGGGAALVVTHDEGFAAAAADRHVTMADGGPRAAAGPLEAAGRP